MGGGGGRGSYITISQALPGGGGGGLGTGENGIYFKGNKGQILMGTKTLLGNREHKKTNFRFWGIGEQANLFHVYPPPPPPHTHTHHTHILSKGVCVQGGYGPPPPRSARAESLHADFVSYNKIYIVGLLVDTCRQLSILRLNIGHMTSNVVYKWRLGSQIR